MTDERDRSSWTATEEHLCAAWAEVLNVIDIAPDDTFFDLGGDSISATFCLNRIKAVFNVTVPMSLLLDEHTTLRALAIHLDRLSSSAPSDGRTAWAPTP